jgi:hypothetical protein
VEKDNPAKVNQNDPKLPFFVDFCRVIFKNAPFLSQHEVDLSGNDALGMSSLSSP